MKGIFLKYYDESGFHSFEFCHMKICCLYEYEYTKVNKISKFQNYRRDLLSTL